MIAVKSPLMTPLTASLAIEERPQAPQFGWLFVQSPTGEWVALCDLKPYGDVLQPTLIGWTKQQWESAFNDLIVYHVANPGSEPVRIPKDSDEARRMMLRWLHFCAKPGDGRRVPAVASDTLFENIQREMMRKGMVSS